MDNENQNHVLAMTEELPPQQPPVVLSSVSSVVPVVVAPVVVTAPATTLSLLETTNDDSFRWSIGTVVQAMVVFLVAGFAEIGGGYLVWKAIRGDFHEDEVASGGNNNAVTKKRWCYAIVGSFLLVLYGFIPTLQPTDSFGRIYAVYGGFFIVLSFLAGWYLDNDRPDLGDVIGGSIALLGVLLVLFWPR